MERCENDFCSPRFFEQISEHFPRSEEIAEIDPRFVTYNDKGEVEGLKYDRIGVVLVNAVNEQQDQIETQNKTIKAQQSEIYALRTNVRVQMEKVDQLTKLVCALKPEAEICRQP